MLDKPLKEEDFSPEELKKCKEDPLYFFNKYVKHKGKRDLTQEEYDSIVTARTKPEFMLRNRYGKTVFAYPKIPGSLSVNGTQPSITCFDEAGDPRLMSETQKQNMVDLFNAAKPKTDENTKRND